MLRSALCIETKGLLSISNQNRDVRFSAPMYCPGETMPLERTFVFPVPLAALLSRLYAGTKFIGSNKDKGLYPPANVRRI